jgi:hypothetical protein
LKEVTRNSKDFKEKIKDAFGNAAFDVSTADIWERLANAADTDTARAAFMQQLKLLTGAIRQQDAGEIDSVTPGDVSWTGMLEGKSKTAWTMLKGVPIAHPRRYAWYHGNDSRYYRASVKA